MVFFVFILMVIAAIFYGYEPNIWWLMSLALFWIGDSVCYLGRRFDKGPSADEVEEYEKE